MNSTAAGTVSGMALASVKAVITFGASLDTLVYAIIGAAGGWIVTEILKYIKSKITKK
jgi:uncharacterized membrane protein YuzA (DUF378 family)